MNLGKYFLLMAVAVTGFQSCDDDDNMAYVPEALKEAFSQKYPSVHNERWVTRGNYYVAGFSQQMQESSAWFTPDGEWQMTETDISYAALPAPVKSAFEGSEYARWEVDDIDRLERLNLETVYVVEVESGEREMDLYYSAGGVLIKSEIDTDDDSAHYLPMALPEVVKQFVEEHYPGALVAEVEREHGRLEVDILHERVGKELTFGVDNNWLRTSWEVAVATLPAKVTQAISQAPQYTGYHIDEADFVETPEGDFYELELEKGESEIKVKVTAEGELMA